MDTLAQTVSDLVQHVKTQEGAIETLKRQWQELNNVVKSISDGIEPLVSKAFSMESRLEDLEIQPTRWRRSSGVPSTPMEAQGIDAQKFESIKEELTLMIKSEVGDAVAGLTFSKDADRLLSHIKQEMELLQDVHERAEKATQDVDAIFRVFDMEREGISKCVEKDTTARLQYLFNLPVLSALQTKLTRHDDESKVFFRRINKLETLVAAKGDKKRVEALCNGARFKSEEVARILERQAERIQALEETKADKKGLNVLSDKQINRMDLTNFENSLYRKYDAAFRELEHIKKVLDDLIEENDSFRDILQHLKDDTKRIKESEEPGNKKSNSGTPQGFMSKNKHRLEKSKNMALHLNLHMAPQRTKISGSQGNKSFLKRSNERAGYCADATPTNLDLSGADLKIDKKTNLLRRAVTQMEEEQTGSLERSFTETIKNMRLLSQPNMAIGSESPKSGSEGYRKDVINETCHVQLVEELGLDESTVQSWTGLEGLLHEDLNITETPSGSDTSSDETR